MDRLRQLVVIAVAALLAASCGHRGGRIFPFGWERVGERFDSLTEAVEWKFIDGAGYDSIQADVDALNTLAAADPGNVAKRVRAEYFDARLRLRLGREDEAMELSATPRPWR